MNGGDFMIDLENYVEEGKIYLYKCTNKYKEQVSSIGAFWDRNKQNPYLNYTGCWYLDYNTALKHAPEIARFLPELQNDKKEISRENKKNLYFEVKNPYGIKLEMARNELRSIFLADKLRDFLYLYQKFPFLDVYSAVLCYLRDPSIDMIGDYEFWNNYGYRINASANASRLLFQTKIAKQESSSMKKDSMYTKILRSAKGKEYVDFGNYRLCLNQDDTLSLFEFVYGEDGKTLAPLFENVARVRQKTPISSFISSGYIEKGDCIPLFTNKDVSVDLNSPNANRKMKSFTNPFEMSNEEDIHLSFAVLSFLSGVHVVSSEEELESDDCLYVPRDNTPFQAMRRMIAHMAHTIYSKDTDVFFYKCIYIMMLHYFSVPLTDDDDALLSLHHTMEFARERSVDFLRASLENVRYHFFSFVKDYLSAVEVDPSNIREMDGYQCPCFSSPISFSEDALNQADANLFTEEDDGTDKALEFFQNLADNSSEEGKEDFYMENVRTNFEEEDKVPLIKDERYSVDVDDDLKKESNSIIYSPEDNGESDDDGSLMEGNINLVINRKIDIDSNPFTFSFGEVLIGSTGIAITFNMDLASVILTDENSTTFSVRIMEMGAKRYDVTGGFDDGLPPEDFDFEFFKCIPYEPISHFNGEIFETVDGIEKNVCNCFFLDKVIFSFANNAIIQMVVDIPDMKLRTQENSSTIPEYNSPSSLPETVTDIKADTGTSAIHNIEKPEENKTPEDEIRRKTEKQGEGQKKVSTRYTSKPQSFVPLVDFENLEKMAVQNGIESRLRTPLPLSDYKKAIVTVPFLKEQANVLSQPKLIALYDMWKFGWKQADRLHNNKLNIEQFHSVQLIAVTQVEDDGKKERNFISTFHEFFEKFDKNIDPESTQKAIWEENKDFIQKNPAKFVTFLTKDCSYRIACIPKNMIKEMPEDTDADIADFYDNAFLLAFLRGDFRCENACSVNVNDFSYNTPLANRVVSFLGVNLNDYNDKTVNFFVAECGEFPSLGLYRDGLSFKEAVDMFSKLYSEHELGKAIGVTVDNNTDVPYSTQIYPLNFIATQAEPFRSLKVVQDACAYVLGRMNANDVFAKNKTFVNEPLPSIASSERTKVTVEIFQVKDEVALTYRFRDYNYLVNTMKKKVLPSNYNKVVSMHMNRVPSMDTLLEDIYTLSNVRLGRFAPYILEGVSFHEIATGDVISITTTEFFNNMEQQRTISYYVNSSGFVTLPNFTYAPLGNKVRKRKNKRFWKFMEMYDVSPSLAIWEAGQDTGLTITELQAKLMASVDGMLLSLPRDDRSLKRYLKKGLDLAKKMQSMEERVFVQVNCSRYPKFPAGMVRSFRDFNILIATEKTAIKKYYLEHGKNSYIGDDEIRLNIFLNKTMEDELRIYTLPVTIFIGDLSFQNFTSNVEAVINDNLRSCKQYIEMGKIGCSPISSEKKLELKTALENLHLMANEINRLNKPVNNFKSKPKKKLWY